MSDFDSKFQPARSDGGRARASLKQLLQRRGSTIKRGPASDPSAIEIQSMEPAPEVWVRVSKDTFERES